MTAPLLIASRSAPLRRLLRTMLRTAGFDALGMASAHEALYRVTSAAAAGLIVTLDVQDAAGLDVLATARRMDSALPLFVVLERPLGPGELAKLGASDFVFQRPLKGSELAGAVRATLIERGRL